MFDFFQWSDLNPGRLGEKRKCYLCAVTNAIKALLACIYKSVKTGLFLQSVIAPCVVMFNMIMVFFTLNYQIL